MPTAAFYSVSDSSYFLGAVGLINSLRLMGHPEPIYLLDCGLEEWQRQAIEGEVTIVPMPAEGGPPVTMLKGVAPLAHPAEVMVLIDIDMLITRSLEPLIECAGEGRIVAFKDHDVDRFRPEWGQLLDLGDLRRQPYLCAGLVALGAEPGDEVLRRLNQLSDRVDFERTAISGALGPRPGHPGQRRRPAHAYPFLNADQDLLNAILAGCVEAERVVALEYGLAPMWPFSGVQLLDERSLRCAYKDGTEPYLLHQVGRKPWLEPTTHRLYSRLLSRTLQGDDVAIKLPPWKLPLRLRRGRLAALQRMREDIVERVRWRYVRWRLSVLRRYLARRG
jgi:hypothetical protein